MATGEFEKMLFVACMPTFSGLQVANILSLKEEKQKQADTFFRMYKKELSRKGLYVYPLARKKDYLLVLLFHIKSLRKVLAKKEVQNILLSFGYKIDTPLLELLTQLKRRLEEKKRFPHEIGLFLGYPPCDVRGFIENQGDNFLYAGYWKVYENAQETLAKFADCKAFTKKYIENYKERFQVPNFLTIAK